MVNLADLDTVFLVPCKHCAQLMQETERFCPFCGKDQSASVQEPMDHALPKKASNDEVDFDLGLVHPSDYWQKEILEAGNEKRWTGNYRLVIGIVAGLMALLVFALVHDDFYLGKQSEESKLKTFRANVEQVQRALSRGDLSAAERVLDALEADYAEAPSVQELREAFDRRVQEQTARQESARQEQAAKEEQSARQEQAARQEQTAKQEQSAKQEQAAKQEQTAKQEQRREPDVKASKAAEPGRPSSRSVQAPLVPASAPAVGPGPEISATDSKEKECNEALRAMALCPTR